jgi:hypothetical protein
MAADALDWTDPTKDRRRHDSPGRRARDYDTCHFHEGQCDKVASLEKQMVGWRVFNLVAGGLGAAVLFIGAMTWSINVKVDALVSQVNLLSIELTKHTAASERR